MFSKIHLAGVGAANSLLDVILPSLSIITISPGSTSLTNSASTVSRAHVSEVMKYVLSLFPIQSGLKPNGSLTPINFLGLVITSEYAPLSCLHELRRASSTDFVLTLSRAKRYPTISESEPLWKIAPSYESFSLSSFA